MNAVQRIAKRIVSKIEAGQAAEAPRRMSSSYIVKSGQFFVPERISMFMRPNPGEEPAEGKGISPVTVRKEFRPIVKDREWVPRYMLQGLGEVELDLEARFREIQNRIRSYRRKVEVFLMTGKNRERAAKAIATSTARLTARRIAGGSNVAGLGEEDGWWDWLTDTAQGAADYVQDTILGMPGATDADRTSLQDLQNQVQTQKADRIVTGQSTEVQDRLLVEIGQSQADLYEPTSVMVTATIDELRKRIPDLPTPEDILKYLKYAAVGVVGLIALKFFG